MKRPLLDCLILLMAVAVLSWLSQGHKPGSPPPLREPGKGASSQQSPAGSTRLDLKGTPGEWITQGKDWHFSPSTDRFTCRYDGSNSKSGISVVVERPKGNPFVANFGAPYGQMLTVGHYKNATRFPFQAKDAPGLSIEGDARGCNRLQGSFEVLEIEHGMDGPTRLAVDFIQISEYRPEWVFRGSVRYHSTLP